MSSIFLYFNKNQWLKTQNQIKPDRFLALFKSESKLTQFYLLVNYL